jgi:P-type conjugative transfer protein TrbJ
MLQAARALEQINNQIRALQNQAVMLENMARNLTSLDHSSLGELTGALVRIDALMREAEGLSFSLDRLEDQWRARYPESYDSTVTVDDMVCSSWPSKLLRKGVAVAISLFSGLAGQKPFGKQNDGAKNENRRA